MRKQREQRTNLLLWCAALGGACLVMAGCHQETGANSPTPVRATAVSTSDAAGAVRYSASIVANAQVNLVFKSGGYVDSITQRKGADGRMRPLEAGDVVSAGELLAAVRQRDYADRVAQAKAQLEQAKAGYEHSRQDFERAANLFASGSMTKSQYDAAKSSNDANAAALESAKAALSQAETAQNDATLHAPFGGWVVERDIEIGSLAGTAAPAFVIADTRVVKAVFGIPDTMIKRVHLGDRLSISTITVPGEIWGHVTSISPSADPKSRVFSVEVTIPNGGNVLKSGMIATLSLGGQKLPEPVTVVPLSAIVRSSKVSGEFAVFVLSESSGKTIARERDVKIGETIGNSIAVTQGLRVGEQVVSVGATEIKDGEQVQVLL